MASKREITYYDVSPYAALSAKGDVWNGKAQEFSQIWKLFADNMIYRSIQTCEHNHTILDGSHREFQKNENIALWSKLQSANPSRLFSEDVTLEITFGGLQSGPGITFYFDTQNHNWCDMLRVKWYKDSNLLANEMFYPDAMVYSCHRQVNLYNRVTVEFLRMNMPNRFLKIEVVLFGIVRVFDDGDLENVTVNEGFDPTGRTIYINSANFTVNTKDPIPYIFMKRQPLKITYNGLHMGTYYIDKSKKYADKRYAIEAIDKIGVLDVSGEFMGGVYVNITAGNLINQIVGGLFDVDIDANLKDMKINGWLPIMKKREALAQVALASGAIIDATRSNYITVRPLEVVENEYFIGKDRVYQSSSVDIEFPFTGIELIEHNFSAGTASKELYKDTFVGEKTVRFSEPASNLTITGGTILFSGENHAVINGSGSCVLSGRPYIDSKSSVVIKKSMDDDLPEGTQERIEKIENCYLVNKLNSQTVAKRLYDYYLRGNVFDGDFLTGTDNASVEKIGDIVKIATAFNEDISGQIEKLTLRLGYKNIKARGIVRGQ